MLSVAEGESVTLAERSIVGEMEGVVSSDGDLEGELVGLALGEPDVELVNVPVGDVDKLEDAEVEIVTESVAELDGEVLKESL